MNSKLRVYLCPAIIPERQLKADCEGLQKISWHGGTRHSLTDEIQWQQMQGNSTRRKTT